MSKSVEEMLEYQRKYRATNREYLNALERERYRSKNPKNHGLSDEWISAREAQKYWMCESWDLEKWRKEGLPHITISVGKKNRHYYHKEKGMRWFQGVDFDEKGNEI